MCIRDRVKSELDRRLRPYRIGYELILMDENHRKISNGLKALEDLLPKKNKSNNKESKALIELRMIISEKEENSKKKKISSQLVYWPRKKENLFSSNTKLSVTSEVDFMSLDKVENISRMFDNLVVEWTPIIEKIQQMDQGHVKRLNIKFIGVPGPIEEQLLVKTLFENKPNWGKVNLSSVTKEFISYKAFYNGKREKILTEFIIPPGTRFKITTDYWEKKTKVDEINRKEK